MPEPNTPTPTAAAFHGPYEDAIITLGTLAIEIVKDMPPEAKAQFWSLHMARVDRLVALGEKLRGFFGG